jgi:hypothetical protein
MPVPILELSVRKVLPSGRLLSYPQTSLGIMLSTIHLLFEELCKIVIVELKIVPSNR